MEGGMGGEMPFSGSWREAQGGALWLVAGMHLGLCNSWLTSGVPLVPQTSAPERLCRGV